MDAQMLKQRIDRFEECVDDAKRALQAGSPPQALRDSIDALHQQARQVKHGATSDESALRQSVMQLEQGADRAMQACRDAGNAIDEQTRQAVEKAHSEISGLKKELQAGSPA